MEETIVAPATPVGRGGVAIIRLSGVDAVLVGEGICGKLPKPRHFKPCSVVDPKGDMIDSGLVVFFSAPQSYTGEDVVEIHCHGNPLIVDSIVSVAVELGARMAEPGEFTKRAYLNNKLDLAQAESVADLISAKTLSAVKGASSSLSGNFSKEIVASIGRLVDIRVLVEAALDFPEEEGALPATLSPTALNKKIKKEVVFIKRLLADSGASVRLREGAKVVIVGPPNCGKSTLLNYFAANDLAIVSSSPGTTRDAIRVGLDFGGVPVELVDTAGLRSEGGDLIEEEGMRRTMLEAGEADLILLMSEVNQDFVFPLLEGVPVLRVFNKSDLFFPKDLAGPGGSVFISALRGDGVDELIKSMSVFLCANPSSEVPLLARRRHLVFLESSLSHLSDAASLLESGDGFEFIAEELRCAQTDLGEITNPLSADDLLGEIFSSFCIGK